MPQQTEQQKIASLQDAGLTPVQSIGVQAGIGYTPTIPAYTPPAAVTSSNLQTGATYQPPPSPPSTVPSALSSLGSISDVFNKVYGDTTSDTAYNNNQTQLSELQKRIGSMGGVVGSNGLIDTTGASTKAKDIAASQLGYKNYADLLNQSQDLSSQITGIKNTITGLQTYDATKDPALAGRGITIGGAASYQANNSEAIRQNTIKALGLASLGATLQGNIARAEDIAKNAVEQEFLPYQIQLNQLQMAYNMNKDNLGRQDKKKEAELSAYITERTRLLNAAKDDKTAGLALVNAAVSNNPGNQAAQQAAQRALQLDTFSPDYLQQVFNLVGQYQTDPNATQLAITNLKLKQEELRQAPLSFSLEQEARKAQIAASYASTAKLKAETLALIDEGYLGGQYSSIIGTILGSGSFTKQQAATIRNAINNGEDPVTVIKNNAKKIMGQTEATSVTKFEAAKIAMLNLQSELQAFYDAGGKTNIFSGNYEKVFNNLGAVKDPRLVELATQIQSSLQIYRNAVSGTAYSEQEGKDIASIFPGINKTQGLNTAIMKGRIKAFDDAIDGPYEAVLGSAYNKLKTASSSQPGTKVTVQGQEFTVGQIYEDAKGNRGTFDANGNWIKQ